MIYILFLVGLLSRILFIPSPGFKADMAYWKAWGLALADKGLLWVSKNTNYNYPPGFAYVLYIINKIYAFFRNPYNIGEYWDEANIYYLALFKALPIVSDILVAVVIYLIAKALKYKRGWVLALLFFLSPAVILDGAVWGQVDQFGLLLFLISVYFLITDKYRLAAAVFTISTLMKFQNIIFIPLFYLYIYRKYTFVQLIDSLKISFLVFIGVNLPFFLAKDAGALFRLLTVNSDWFPHFSLNAFNIWWIASGANGMGVSDKNLVFGITSAKAAGLFMFTAAYFIACVSLFRERREDLMRKFIIVCAFAVFAFFHLLTESHERYLFHLTGLLPILIIIGNETLNARYRIFRLRVRAPSPLASSAPPKSRKMGILLSSNSFFIFYIVFSALFFANLYIAFIFNYPDVLFWPAGQGITSNLSIILSYAQITAFIYFFAAYMGADVVKNWRLIFPFIGLLILTLFIQNADYIRGKPILLTKIVPIVKNQDYLEPLYNKNLNSKLGTFAYDRMSSNYYFYEGGIASHANSAITYSLDGKFSRFRSDYGIDSEGRAEAEVYFIIEGDGRELFRSAKKTRFEMPSTVTVDIKGVDRLTLKIEKAGESNFGAHADWLEPMLIR